MKLYYATAPVFAQAVINFFDKLLLNRFAEALVAHNAVKDALIALHAGDE